MVSIASVYKYYIDSIAGFAKNVDADPYSKEYKHSFVIWQKWLGPLQYQVQDLSEDGINKHYAAFTIYLKIMGNTKNIDKNDTNIFLKMMIMAFKNYMEKNMLYYVFYQCGVNGMKNTLPMRTIPPIIPIAHTFDFSRFFMLIPYLREGTITRVVSAVCYFYHFPSIIA